MRLTFLKGIALGAVTSMLTLGTSAALAGTGPGATFNLGKVNKVNATSTLTGSATGSMLQVTNTGTGTGASGAQVTGSSLSAPDPDATATCTGRGDNTLSEFKVTTRDTSGIGLDEPFNFVQL